MVEPSQEPPRQKARPTPSFAQALGWLAFAVMFAVLMGLEHRWRLSRGDYPGIGIDHTWYWYLTTRAAVVLLAARLVLALARRARS